MSQGLEVLPPKSDKAYPIPCKEWDSIKARVQRLTDEPFVFQTIGAALLGASLSTMTSVFTGSISGTNIERTTALAWAIIGTTGLVGIACLAFAKKERVSRRERAADIVEQMRLIEARFDGIVKTAPIS
jgi:hypothetical protein